jgi:hypothetical protein
VLLLLTAAVVSAIALAVGTAPRPAPAPKPASSPLALASTFASTAASADTAPSPQAAPSSKPPIGDVSTIVVLRGVVDPGKTLGTLAGCTPLFRVTGQAIPAISGTAVDAATVAAGRETGWLFVPPGIQALTRVWLGDDVVELARAAGSPVVAMGTDGDVWLGGPAGAGRWRPIPTPAGRTAWVLTADVVTSHGRCGPWTVPAGIGGQRSVTCAGVAVPACLRLLARVQADTPGLPYAGGDMALAGPACRAPSMTCASGELTAVAVPPGWAGTIAGVQAAVALRASAAFWLLAPGAASDDALDAVSRPSLPLPTEAAEPAHACAATLTGDLRAAPGDPRVFWVGVTAVVWPAGTRARFGDTPSLTVPRADGSYRFVERAAMRLQGSVDPQTHAFVVCTATPVSVDALTAPPSP